MHAARALVIDDSRAMRMVLGGLLADMGFEVDEAEHGERALAMLGAATAPDVVLVDWNMPVMNGLDFIKAVRGSSAFAGVRLLVITSETEVGQMINALAAGADEYLMKPFTADALLHKLEILGLGVVKSVRA